MHEIVCLLHFEIYSVYCSFATGDHAVISSQDLTTLVTIPQNLTVRTVATDSTESPDSQPMKLTSNVVDEMTKALNNLPPTQVITMTQKPTQVITMSQ